MEAASGVREWGCEYGVDITIKGSEVIRTKDIESARVRELLSLSGALVLHSLWRDSGLIAITYSVELSSEYREIAVSDDYAEQCPGQMRSGLRSLSMLLSMWWRAWVGGSDGERGRVVEHEKV
ncbi:hypothetical protein Tco_1237986 [Tanacetum coccineum]